MLSTAEQRLERLTRFQQIKLISPWFAATLVTCPRRKLSSSSAILVIAPPGSSIDSTDKLKSQTIGVVGGVANSKIVDVLTKEYDLARAKVVFKDLALADVRQAIQSRQVNVLLVAIPLAEKYLSLVRGD